ncbi:MAG: hypothetical protein EOO43_24155 [Flavobacterium sp.]|nr:MAG: hypothetical protein EOO43_24155 [Flavobacterium sp.]
MKKIIFAISFILALSNYSVYAASTSNADGDPEQIFKESFPTAECVKWSREGEYRKVSFVLFGRGAQAIFSPEGDLLGTMRNVLYADLPIKVMTSIRKRFSNSVPFAITEINRVDGTLYKFSVEIKNRRYDATISQEGAFTKVVAR